MPPDTLTTDSVRAAIYADENLIWGDPPFPNGTRRNVVLIGFHPEATQGERQQAIDLVQGEVLGGVRIRTGGFYSVRVQTDGTADSLAGALEQLRGLSQVKPATPHPLGIVPAHRKPNDRPGYTLSKTQIDSIRLTYICGNRFRVRNPNDTEVTVIWDVYEKSEKGTLVLPPRLEGVEYSETLFETQNKGTVRLFLDGKVIETKANGGTVCESSVVPPQAPDTLPAWVMSGDSTVAFFGVPEYRVVRNVVRVKFKAGTPQADRQAAIDAIDGEVIGGRPAPPNVAEGTYYVRIQGDDTGRAAVDAADYLEALPQVRNASFVLLAPREWFHAWRLPSDSLVSSRSQWRVQFDPASSLTPTWSREIIDAPLAWGCETGSAADQIQLWVGSIRTDPEPAASGRSRSVPYPPAPTCVVTSVPEIGSPANISPGPSSGATSAVGGIASSAPSSIQAYRPCRVSCASL